MQQISAQLQSQIANRQSKIPSVTWRSLTLGTVAVLIVCGLTPLNDFVLSDTSLVAGFVPLAAVLILFALVVGINAPLHRWAPRHALNTGELAVIVLLTLVACGLPNWGLMRFLAPTPVAPFHVGASDEQFWHAFLGLNLPHWLFPVSSVANGRSDPAVTWFFTRVPQDGAIPWRAWMIPALAWGVFVAAMLATLVAVARIIVDQWLTNERLSFPLAQVQWALIEPPSPGRALNELFRSRILWAALLGVLAVHTLSCLNAFFPRNFPPIPLRYDLSNILADEPFVYLRPKVKKAALSFTVVGVTYFIRSRAAFSLWAIYLLTNLVDVQQGMRQSEMPGAAWQDQHLGACVAFIAGVVWIGRHQWARIFRCAIGRAREGERGGGGTSFWIAVAGTAVMLGWLSVLGVRPSFAALIVLFILAAHLVVTRVVAETGLPFYRTGLAVSQVYSNFSTKLFSGRDIFFAQVLSVLGPLTTRDSVATFATHGLAICRNAKVGADEPREHRRLGLAIAWALLFGVIVAGVATLYCQYSYPTPVAQDTTPARNYFGAEYIPRRDIANPFTDFSRGRFTPKQHDWRKHVSIGFFTTVALEIASLRWANWPFLPVGYVASYGAFIENAWFSIFIGWLAQRLVVRLGGASLFQRAKPFFVGIIFGEALAAGLWLVVNAVVVLHGGESQAVKFLL
jgi:hypothetical protein